MNRSALVMLVCCAVLSPAFGSAEEQPVVAQEFSAPEGRPIFWWTRREDEYTLQFFTGMVVSQPTAKCERAEPPPGVDRGSFFIGSTIACLRGLDPTFGARTLTLIDGRRRAGGTAQGATTQPAVPAPPVSAPAPAPTPAPPAADIQVWLLHKDGSVITPRRKSPVDPDKKYCSYGRCESGFVYGYDPAAARDAVAVAYKMGDDVHIQKLQPFADEQD
jgi:hypothetical protein